MAKVKVKIRFISLTYLLKLFLLLCLSFVLLSGLCHLLDLHINVTSSLPYGLYKKVDKTDICKGDIILFCLEGEQAEFAKKRNYLTFGSCPNDMAPIGKKVIATKDDHITLNNEGIKVNGTLLEKTAASPIKTKLKSFVINAVIIPCIILIKKNNSLLIFISPSAENI